MFRKTMALCAFLIFAIVAKADEGLWLPILLEQLNQEDMQSMGMKLTAEDIYSINKSSLKDAVCLFGGGCTAEVISDKGLIITNHHCGYSAIQANSTLEKDYLTNGFWAPDYASELPNPGYTVTFLISMEDVTNKVLAGVNSKMTEAVREEIIKRNSEYIEKEAIKDTHYKAKVKAFYYGNEYYLFITETFTDVRLVGAPPSAIGKFGGDTDNWMWPRHTGDFALFRIYADKDNNPADYSADNVPYIPKRSLTISLKGIKENDFTMVYGYPGTTQEYLTSYAVNLVANIEDPIKVGIRDAKLNIMRDAMSADPLVKLKYANKYQSVANAWKKWIGENKGLRIYDAVDRKATLEKQFQLWADSDSTRSKKYGKLLPAFAETYKQFAPVALANDYFIEAGYTMDIIKYCWGFNALVNKCLDRSSQDSDIVKLAGQHAAKTIYFFKNYDVSTDKKLMSKILSIYFNSAEEPYKPSLFSLIQGKKYKGNVQAFIDKCYATSVFVDEAKVKSLMKDFTRKKVKLIVNDPLYAATESLYENYINNILPTYNNLYDRLDSLYRIYMTGLREMQPEKVFYPDANSTLRITYGKVEGYQPMDGVKYRYYTTLDGMIEKEDPDIEDYKVPAKLKELYEAKDFGVYAVDSVMPIAFIASNHTTGGNSGSPVLNAEGQLIGVNFDRVWEATMSDIMYNPARFRNISLDIRFALFIIDKFAGAKNIMNELKIAN